MTDAEFREKIELLKRLGLLALLGCALLVGALFLSPDSAFHILLLVAAVVSVLPAVFYLVILTVWHWKGRYRGSHSQLWGALLVIETSGWMKLVYLFRHILPDARGTGRYVRSHPDRPA